MVAKQAGVLPVGLKMHDTPAIGACRGSDAGAFRLATFMAQNPAIVGDRKPGVTAGPTVRTGAELIRKA